MEKYVNRSEAGKILAKELKGYSKKNVIVLALPRGGVPVAYEIAKVLSVPLDVFIVRKLGVPGQEELAFGAIASGNMIVFNEDILDTLAITESKIKNIIKKEQEELTRREKIYRLGLPSLNLTGKTVILVDDGIATGATIRAAIKAIYKQKPISMIVAVPVAAESTYKEIAHLVDEMICPLTPQYFSSVGSWYEEFSQTTDQQVVNLLSKIKE